MIQYLKKDELGRLKQFEGEWVLVKLMRTTNVTDWIRWRKDGRMLIGYILNYGIVSEQ